MNTKEKKLAMVLASGLIVSNLGVVTASADTNIANNNSALMQNQQVNYPTVTPQTIKFDKDSSENLVITGIDYFNQTLVKFTVADGQNIHELNVNNLIYDNNQKTLTIPTDVLNALNLSNGMHACGLTFSDGTLYVGAITIYATNSNTSTTPPVVPPSNGGSDVTPPSNVTKNPTVEKQELVYDKANPEDLIVKNVNYDGTDLRYIYIGSNLVSAKDLVLGNDTITIPSKVLSTLTLVSGNYDVSFKFSDGTSILGNVDLTVKDNTVVVPPTTPIVPPSNGETDVKPPVNVNANPTVKEQILNYDKSKSENVVIKDVNYDGTQLEFIYIGSNLVDAKNLVLTNDTITIPANILSNLTLVSGNYDVSFKFSNGTSVIGNVYLAVKDSSVVAPPSNDKDSEVIIDINNLKPVEIPNFIPNNSKVDYVIINGKKLPVIYKNLRNVDDISSAPAVYIVGDKLVLSPEVLEYIGFDSSTYDIQAVLEDGNVVSKTISLNITNSTEKPEQKPEDEQKPEEEQKPITPSEDKENIKNPSSNNNKNESLTGTSNIPSKLPNTGYAVTSSFIGTLITGIGAVLFKKKK